MKSPEQFNNKKDERIEDIKLAEGMAYAEKPYRDMVLQRKAGHQARYDFIHSDEYREHLRRIQEEHQEMTVMAMNSVDEKMREKMTIEEAWKRNREALRKMSLDERGGVPRPF